ncbi:hypothetical protein PAECIP111892_03070 [Paenibacillus auburnensis]|uniref:Uncharacterized protein n=1 Tax=Paenibacillus auburnensis TaxID=2905649 RepID=A0ABN8GGA3_9BACL|nr:hypothetical protein [Paenibacillus auburnensis]CAH1208210.1 hypothetical protein PAECIP111892_03070 [Paenibacillus auburnensis]
MNNALAWVAIFIGLIVPILSILYLPKTKGELFFYSYLPSIFMSLIFITIGLRYSTWAPIHQKVGVYIFTIYFLELSFSSFFFIFYVCKEMLRQLVSPNPWDAINKKASLFIRFFLVTIFMLLSSFMFSPLYSLWNILSTHNIELGIGDAFYYGISVVYSIPQTGLFQQFQHEVNSDIMLRIIQVVHILTTKLIEFIVLGFIISQIKDLLLSKETPEASSNCDEQHLLRNTRSRRIHN